MMAHHEIGTQTCPSCERTVSCYWTTSKSNPEVRMRPHKPAWTINWCPQSLAPDQSYVRNSATWQGVVISDKESWS